MFAVVFAHSVSTVKRFKLHVPLIIRIVAIHTELCDMLCAVHLSFIHLLYHSRFFCSLTHSSQKKGDWLSDLFSMHMCVCVCMWLAMPAPSDLYTRYMPVHTLYVWVCACVRSVYMWYMLCVDTESENDYFIWLITYQRNQLGFTSHSGRTRFLWR